jgi:hypothetical protein
VWRRQEEPVLDRATLDGIIRMLMEINAKLDLLLADDDEDDDEEN